MACTSFANSMLSTAVVVGLLLVVVADAVPAKCPKYLPPNEIVQIPHEYDCTKYYICLDNEKKMLKECPLIDGDRLFFNPKLQVCDWPSETGCDLPLPLRTLKKRACEHGPIPTECPKVDSKSRTVHLAYDGDCTKFYKCLEGSKLLMSCPSDQNGDKLYFNPCEQVCDWRSNVVCTYENELKALSVGLSALEDDYPTECPKKDPKNETILLPYEGDCSKYYYCSHGKKYPMDCPVYNEDGAKLHFNPKIHQCDWPENVDCPQDELLPNHKTSEPQTSLPTKCPKYDSINETVLLPHERDCTKFYMCSHGKKVPKQCPEMDDEGNRLYFNFEKQICDWNVDCKLPEPEIRATPIRDRILPVPTECPAQDSPNCTVHIAHEWDCTKFYKCDRGTKVLQSCPDGLHFNKYEQVCDWPWRAGCDSDFTTLLPPITSTSTRRPTTTTTTPRPTRRPTTTTTTPRPTRRPTTTTTTPRPTRPPTTTTTTPRPTRPPTTTTTTPRPTRPPTTTTTTHRPTNPPHTTPDPGVNGCVGTCPDSENPNEIAVLPHEDCRKWCSCEKNGEKVWPCPGNLYFSPTLKKCTSPEISGCNGQRHPSHNSQGANNDEALMNILGYNRRFVW